MPKSGTWSMASSWKNDMRAIWMVRWREMAVRIRFWTAIVGYDPRNRSLSQNVYLVYLVIFFSIWGFSVLALLADAGSYFLAQFNDMPPVAAAVLILTGGMLFEVIWRGYRSCKRSPFIFSEQDATLICQTPLDRRQVALGWFLVDWLSGCIPVLVLAVVLVYSCMQIAQGGKVLWVDLPAYWLAALRISAVILPMHLALMAADYALGALRLQADREIPAIRWLPLGFGILLVFLAVISRGTLTVVMWPLIYPINTAVSGAEWLVGFIIAGFLAMIGVRFLYGSSARLNLSRAAQETQFIWAYRQASLVANTSLTRQMKIREHLGVGHSASRLPGKQGAWSLTWKFLVSVFRTISLSQVLRWLAIFGSNLGMIITADWATKVWTFLFWSFLVGQYTTGILRADLGMWALSQQLPFNNRARLVAGLSAPSIGYLLLYYLAVSICLILGYTVGISFILLAPLVIVSICLANAYDILKHCQCTELLAGLVPEAGAAGLLIGILCAGIPFILIPWKLQQYSTPSLGVLFIFIELTLCCGMSYLLWRLVIASYKNIK